MGEIAGNMRERLLALAVGARLQVMSDDGSRRDHAGWREGQARQRPGRGRHAPERGSVTLSGRRVPVDRPRVRAVDGSGELRGPAYELFSSTEILGRMAMGPMLVGVSTRRYNIRPRSRRRVGGRS